MTQKEMMVRWSIWEEIFVYNDMNEIYTIENIYVKKTKIIEWEVTKLKKKN